METLYELIQKIAKRPGLYLGKTSLERLEAYINGYMHYFDVVVGCRPEGFDCMDGFNQYIANHYRLNTTHGWCAIIRFFSYSEEDAFNTFLKHLDNFVKSKSNSEDNTLNG